MPKFKNFQPREVVASSTIGHTLRFAPGECRDVPEHLVDLALRNGLSPAESLPELEQMPDPEAEAKAEAEKRAARSAAAAKGAATRRAKAAEAAE